MQFSSIVSKDGRTQSLHLSRVKQRHQGRRTRQKVGTAVPKWRRSVESSRNLALQCEEVAPQCQVRGINPVAPQCHLHGATTPGVMPGGVEAPSPKCCGTTTPHFGATVPPSKLSSRCSTKFGAAAPHRARQVVEFLDRGRIISSI
ncbi:hypothetical protein TorRG33x02_323680 [Trema orientale]|uniref:Uncharacterized protein n=1 Tax=Trema orientale TaxID=63057 RepID=A0A2P5BEU9_TREOI|nr:hypothetical protein TorRG33x02_323680 [Trema orientale]